MAAPRDSQHKAWLSACFCIAALLSATNTAATAAAASNVYPSVTPQPQLLSQTVSGGATARVGNPASLSVSVKPVNKGDAVDEATVQFVELAAERSMTGLMLGVNSTTLPYLRIRLPPFRNFTDAGAGIPDATLTMKRINVMVQNLGEAPSAAALFGIDESFTLDIAATSSHDAEVTISANTHVGAAHAFTVLSQLIVWDGSSWIAPHLPVHVEDAPRFQWRGLMLDTARHYVPAAKIEHILEGMAMLRLNVLHWHIVDAQAFAFVSKTWPKLSQGAMHPSLVYTHDTVTQLIQFALARGIRIVPEFDMPGHDAAWGIGYPELITPCWDFVRSHNVGDFGQLEYTINLVSMDVTKPNTLSFVDGLLQEVSQLFPDPFLHLGGDEVQAGCWNSDPAVVAFMQQHNLSTASALQAWFTDKVQAIASKYGRRAVLWEEAFETGATANHSSTVVNVWTQGGMSDLPAIRKDHEDVVISYGAYLDRQNPADGTHWMFISTWLDMYRNMIPADVQAGVLGGEASSWGENADAGNLDNRVFHRMAAIAERLWSSVNVTDVDDARVRFAELRCKMLRRGIEAGPLFPDYCDVAMEPMRSSLVAQGWQSATIALAVIAGLLTVACVVLVLQLRKVSAKAPADAEAKVPLTEAKDQA